MPFEPLDGPASQGLLTVTDTAEVEAKVNVVPLEDRKVVTIQPQDGDVYLMFESGKPGLVLRKWGIYTFEASDQQQLFLKAKTPSSVNVIIVERA